MLLMSIYNVWKSRTTSSGGSYTAYEYKVETDRVKGQPFTKL